MISSRTIDHLYTIAQIDWILKGKAPLFGIKRKYCEKQSYLMCVGQVECLVLHAGVIQCCILTLDYFFVGEVLTKSGK